VGIAAAGATGGSHHFFKYSERLKLDDAGVNVPSQSLIKRDCGWASVLGRAGRERQRQAVQRIATENLAGETGVGLHIPDAVEHVLFLVAGHADHVEPVLVDIDMASGAAE